MTFELGCDLQVRHNVKVQHLWSNKANQKYRSIFEIFFDGIH